MTVAKRGVSSRSVGKLRFGRMRGENDNLDVGAEGAFLPSTVSVLLPAAVILGGYGLTYAWLALTGRGDGALARLCLIVLALGGPFLIAHAVLRRFTARVDVMSHAVFVHTGFPRSEPYEIPYALIRRLTSSRGPVGRLTGSGTLVFELSTRQTICVADIARPSQAISVIGHRIEEVAERRLDTEIPVKTPLSAAIIAS